MRKLICLGLVLAMFISCDKDDDNDEIIENKNKEASYLPLEIGNYWIYQHYNIDSLGNETQVDRMDSVLISKDTMINDLQYYVLEGSSFPTNNGIWGPIDFLRDSSGYVVNFQGKIRFSEDNFVDTLVFDNRIYGEDTVYTSSYKMENTAMQVSVPAGEFEVLNFKGTLYTPHNHPRIANPRYLNTYYSKNVGKVLSTYFYIHSLYISEKRLVRYYVGIDE